ncbi:MAG: S8 family serine peptidase, partial [Anaerolineales bacterium]
MKDIWSGEPKFDIKHQVMVVGPVGAVDQMVATFLPGGSLLLDQPLGLTGNAAVRLYGVLPETSTAVDVALAINTAAITPTEIPVYAEPNTPFGGSFAGDPWSVGGNPDGAVQPIDGEARDYWGQWAFTGAQGIRPGHSPIQTVTGGQGVNVVIFDTSPFGHSNSVVPYSAHLEQFKQWFEGVAHDDPAHPTGTIIDDMSMCVYDPGNITSKSPADQPDYSSHGLFVGGLVFGTAPEVNLHLVRVLNDKAQGTQAMLVSGLLGMLNSQNLGITPTVVNLSLGLTMLSATWTLEDIGITSLTISHLKTVADAVIVPGPSGSAVPIPSGPFLPLALALSQLRQEGVVIVAAAGNGSDAAVAQPALFPASYPDAIAAQGSAADGQRS